MMYQKAFANSRSHGNELADGSRGSRSAGGCDRRTTILIVSTLFTTIIGIVCVIVALNRDVWVRKEKLKSKK
ncbi:CLUMA_CG005188, isoform A [Clunio marinus]|uniref:CLUMA_CG005188, isoform A n=1 Tax=Clunio marinus TaxID=568069 RepID=A0A1J1HTX8_9DIPT|nr:CLUMA_CG005188, isoform A [Clunio marinus]